MTNARKELIKELNKFGFDDTINCCVDINDVVNFILADRKRIVAPLVKFSRNERDYKTVFDLAKVYAQAIDETLKLAGVENDNDQKG